MNVPSTEFFQKKKSSVIVDILAFFLNPDHLNPRDSQPLSCDWRFVCLRVGLKMAQADVDYSLYLVTDSTPAILGDRDLVEVVEAALEGGVTVVQYRDKVSDTSVVVSTAKKLHAITRKHNVPLLINDRIDVALAVGCEGVHIGQADLGMCWYFLK